mgnify:CR=1 FL=1
MPVYNRQDRLVSPFLRTTWIQKDHHERALVSTRTHGAIRAMGGGRGSSDRCLSADVDGVTRLLKLRSLELFQSEVAPVLRRYLPSRPLSAQVKQEEVVKLKLWCWEHLRNRTTGQSTNY